MSTHYILGVDFGTSNSAATIFKDRVPVAVLHQNDDFVFPSFVAFNGNERLLGSDAAKQANANPKNTIYEIKRFLGKQFDDPTIQDDIARLPYSIVSEDGKAVIKVEYMGENKIFSPEQIVAMILASLKENAEKQINGKVTEAVITVPAAYTQSQRHATIDAAAIAGLTVIKILNEPTAAAIQYGFINEVGGGKLVLVFDLGGGTFDVSILYIESKRYKVIATLGDPHLGGSDINSRLKDLVFQKIGDFLSNIIAKNDKAYQCFCSRIESAKQELSIRSETRILLGNLVPEGEIEVTITRAEFDFACEELYTRIITTIEQIIKDAGKQKDNIEEIVFVGGASKTPRIRTIMSDYFPKVQLKENVDPHLAVAQGAAIQAESIKNRIQHEGLMGDCQPIDIIDVLPLSLGIRIMNGKMCILIPRNTPLPAVASKTFTTHKENQTNINFTIYEGEHLNAKDNYLLYEFNVCNIPPGPPKQEFIDAIFEVNKEGMLSVKAILLSNKETICHTVNIKKNNLSHEDIERMIKEAEELKENDLFEERRAAANMKTLRLTNESRSK